MGITKTYKTEVYEHVQPFEKRVYDFCFQRIYELENLIAEASKELRFYRELQDRQKRCEGCNGVGKVRYHGGVNGDDPVDYPCKACKGTGERK